MLKINKKGFALVEVIIVTVFVTLAFTLLYLNVMPIMGGYEAEEKYDSVDSKYTANLISNIIRYESKLQPEHFNTIKNKINSDKYIDITSPDTTIDVHPKVCTLPGDVCQGSMKLYIYGEITARNKFDNLSENANIEKVYLTSFSLEELKNIIRSNPNQFKKAGATDDRVASQTRTYILSLPNFTDDESIAGYRLIVVTRDIYENDTLNYGTIELNI